MGQKVTETALIAAPIDTVWTTIIDLEAYPSWAEGVVEAEVLETTDEGYPERARFLVDANVAEVRYTLRYSYEDYDVRWELVEGDTISQLDGSYELWDEDGGTGVRYSLEADIDLPVPGFIKKRAARQIIEQGLHGLKERAEEEG